MRAIALLALTIAGCSAAAAEDAPRTLAVAAAVAGCETLLDAGTPCDPCPGSPRRTQTDVPEGPGGNGVVLPDGGLADVFSQCDCPAGTKSASAIVWRSCPPLPAGYLGSPATTCAEIAAEFRAACGL